MTAHFGPPPQPQPPMSREDQEWVLASILGLPGNSNYPAVILDTDDAERRMVSNLGSLVLTPLNEVLR